MAPGVLMALLKRHVSDFKALYAAMRKLFQLSHERLASMRHSQRLIARQLFLHRVCQHLNHSITDEQLGLVLQAYHRFKEGVGDLVEVSDLLSGYNLAEASIWHIVQDVVGEMSKVKAYHHVTQELTTSTDTDLYQYFLTISQPHQLDLVSFAEYGGGLVAVLTQRLTSLMLSSERRLACSLRMSRNTEAEDQVLVAGSSQTRAAVIGMRPDGYEGRGGQILPTSLFPQLRRPQRPGPTCQTRWGSVLTELQAMADDNSSFSDDESDGLEEDESAQVKGVEEAKGLTRCATSDHPLEPEGVNSIVLRERAHEEEKTGSQITYYEGKVVDKLRRAIQLHYFKVIFWKRALVRKAYADYFGPHEGAQSRAADCLVSFNLKDRDWEEIYGDVMLSFQHLNREQKDYYQRAMKEYVASIQSGETSPGERVQLRQARRGAEGVTIPDFVAFYQVCRLTTVMEPSFSDVSYQLASCCSVFLFPWWFRRI